MIVGTPREIKDNEYRVGMVPGMVHSLTRAGHRVLIQRGAGAGSGIADAEYLEAGAELVETLEEVYERSEMVVKVKEPLQEEYPHLRPDQILFTFLHLAAVPELARVLVDRRVVGLAYETIEQPDGRLPILAPMSEVAGRMATQIGAHYLERNNGGRGVLLSGLPGVPPADFVVLGAGIAGVNAARIAYGMGARVTVVDINSRKLRLVEDQFSGHVTTVMSTPHNIQVLCERADILVGAVLVAGKSAPRLITRAHLETMKRGSVIVDIAVDQGGCTETTHPTSHSNPTYEVEGVVHYAVTNIPGAVPRTSTFGLTNETHHYVLAIANQGLHRALAGDPVLARGVNTISGHVCHKGVAESLGFPYAPLDAVL